MYKMKNTIKKCCVSFCKNSSNTIAQSQKVTFHEFPSDQLYHDAWLKTLGMEESHVTNTTVVCSLHFKKANYYVAKNGLRMLRKEAVPSILQVCLICLNTDTKLYPMSKYHLEEAYTNVTGLKMPDDINFAQLLCTQCTHRLINGNRFRDNCLKAHKLLLELLIKHELLTTQNIKTINREKYKLVSNLVTKTFGVDHCDLHMIEKNEDNKNVKLENNTYNSVKNVEVKSEIKDTVEIVIEPMDIDLKCDNESDQEFLNDDIDNDTEFLNKGMNVEVKISKNDTEDELNDVSNSELDDSDVELVSAVEVVSDVKVNKSVKSVQKKPVVKRKVNRVNKGRKTTDDKVKKGRKTKDVPKSFKVTDLTYEEQLAEIMERKESSNYKDSRYKCSLCYRGFASQISYDRHVVKHTNKFGEIECTLCKLRFKTRRQMKLHILSFHSMRYSCMSCSFVAKQKTTAALHERWHEGTKYKCPHCDGEFSRYSTYMSHLRLKHPSDFVCALCGYSFVSEKGIQQHCNIKHRFDDKQNPSGPLCEPCDVRFASEAAYNKHMEVSPKHAPEGVRVRNDQHKDYKYGYGKRKKPNDQIDDDNHAYITCEQCGVKLKDFHMYTFHFKRVHPDKKRTQYSYQYSRRSLCEQCGKVFQNPTLLKYHIAEHTGLKPLQCDICLKKFAFKAQLALHMKAHSMRSDFECGICGKHFGYKSNRDRHLWIHHEKYFKCDSCDKTFTTAFERRTHVKHVHLKKPWPKRKRGPRTQGGRGARGKELKTTEDDWTPDYDTSEYV